MPTPFESLAVLDLCLARSFLYRFLAGVYEDPTPSGWAHWRGPGPQRAFRDAIRLLGPDAPALAQAARQFEEQAAAASFEAFHRDYLSAFGHAARGRCPLNEIEYGHLKADPLFQPHRLADLAAFYRAFGLELSDQADERQDHLGLEFEFLCVLTAQEAYLIEHDQVTEPLEICRAAQKRFLREHLGSWVPAFSRRLARMAEGGLLAALAKLTGAFIESECARLQVPCGNEDLVLRPVDEAGESLCASCGLGQSPPGAAAPEAAPLAGCRS